MITGNDHRKGLHRVADGVWAWLAPDGGWGLSNAGLIEGDGVSLLVDTLCCPPPPSSMPGRMSARNCTRCRPRCSLSCPTMWAGPIANWVAACDRMLALEPVTVVPGPGPVTGPAGIRQVRDHLTFIDGYARERHAAGMTRQEAAATIHLGRYAAWSESERTVANLYGAYRCIDPATEEITLAALLTAMAGWDRR